MLKDVVNIPGISMTFVLNKALKMKKPGDPDLYAPGQPCKHKCYEEDWRLGAACLGIGCEDCKQVRADHTVCTKNKPYELLKTGTNRGPGIIFCQYAKVEKSQIRSHKYRNPKTCTSVIRFDANSLYLYCSGQEMPCGKEEYVKIENSQDIGVIGDLFDKVMKDELFGCLQVDI